MSIKKLPQFIGVVRLKPLLGAPQAKASPEEILKQAGRAALDEVHFLEKSGFDGVILENFGDQPFYSSHIPAETIASMAVILGAVRESTQMALGVRVLENNPRSALAIASVCDCQFIVAEASDKESGAILARERLRLESDVQILVELQGGNFFVPAAMASSLSKFTADGLILKGWNLKALPLAAQVAMAESIPLFFENNITCQELLRIKSSVHGVILGANLRLDCGKIDKNLVKKYARFFKKGASSQDEKKSFL